MAESVGVQVGGAGQLGSLPKDRARRDGNAQGKPQLSLVLEFPVALCGAAMSLQEGVAKYGRGDWQKGMPEDEILDSMMRHVVALKRGEVVDPDSSMGATHYDKIVTNALMLSELGQRQRPSSVLDSLMKKG